MGTTGIQRFGQLLGDGGTAALGGIPGQERAEQHTAQRLQVHAGVVVEAFVFRGHGRLYQRLGQFLIPHESTVLYMISGKDFSFLCNYLRCQLGVRVFQFLDGRDIGKSPYRTQQQCQQHYRGYQKNPEPLADCLLCAVRHAIKIFTVRKTLGLVKSSVYKIKQKIWIYPRILRYFAENYRALGPQMQSIWREKT